MNFLVIFFLFAFADGTMFIQSQTAKMKVDPQVNGKDILELKRGDQVTVTKVQGLWSQINLQGKTGWVSKLFLTKTKPIGQAELLNSTNKDSEAKTSRKRSNAYAVSAATRGLTASERVRDGNEMYRSDKAAVDQLEKLEVTEKELKDFQKQGKISGGQ